MAQPAVQSIHRATPEEKWFQGWKCGALLLSGQERPKEQGSLCRTAPASSRGPQCNFVLASPVARRTRPLWVSLSPFLPDFVLATKRQSFSPVTPLSHRVCPHSTLGKSFSALPSCIVAHQHAAEARKCPLICSARPLKRKNADKRRQPPPTTQHSFSNLRFISAGTQTRSFVFLFAFSHRHSFFSRKVL